MTIAIQYGDKIANFKDEYEKIINNITIGKALETLDTKEKEIILLRYYKEMTQVQIAKILNTSQVQVSRIEKKALKKMRDVVYVLWIKQITTCKNGMFSIEFTCNYLNVDMRWWSC